MANFVDPKDPDQGASITNPDDIAAEDSEAVDIINGDFGPSIEAYVEESTPGSI
jgi:hypothetical protein